LTPYAPVVRATEPYLRQLDTSANCFAIFFQFEGIEIEIDELSPQQASLHVRRPMIPVDDRRVMPELTGIRSRRGDGKRFTKRSLMKTHRVTAAV
jgi:hypothetical protein